MRFDPRTLKFLLALGCLWLFPVLGLADGPPPSRPAPCTAPEYHQFDFWIGNWDVYDATGKTLQGTNEVTRVLGDCVLQEHWAGSQGGTGQSFNVYDAARKVWHQTWIDDHGGLLVLEGTFVRGKMILSGEKPTQGEQPAHTDRITWEPLEDGVVRQLWETSNDHGKTWKVAFDGRYKRRA
jgi:hypothetical protein